MKSFIIAAVIGILVVSGSLFYNIKLANLSDEMVEMNNEIYEYIVHEDSENAIKSIQTFEKCLKENKVMLTATGNHEEIENIEIASKEMLEYVICEELSEARVKCASLGVLIKHMPSNYKLKSENIL